jgi:hypothetical protein
MATRKKVKRKVQAKRKKRTVGKATRRTTVRKTTTVGKTVAKKAPHRLASSKKPRLTAETAGMQAPISEQTPKAVRPELGPAQPISSERRIGVVTHYYSHLLVVGMQLEPGARLRVGDVIHIRGHTTDFRQRVESLEVNHASVSEVGPNDDFGLKVVEHAREHDAVFKVGS